MTRRETVYADTMTGLVAVKPLHRELDRHYPNRWHYVARVTSRTHPIYKTGETMTIRPQDLVYISRRCKYGHRISTVHPEGSYARLPFSNE